MSRPCVSATYTKGFIMSTDAHTDVRTDKPRRNTAVFLNDDDGAQVVEYALIIAVVSIALVLGLKALTGIPLSDLFDRISTCLSGTCT